MIAITSRRAATGVLVLAAGCVVGLAGPATARSDSAGSAVARCHQPGDAGANAAADIDGDLVTDPVIGVPGRGPSGGIVVYGSRSGDAPRFLPGSAFPGLDASAAFGTAISRFDVNRDGCDELVVTDPDHSGGAAVDVLWGSPQGVATAGATQLLEQAGTSDGFGTAVTLAPFGTACDGLTCPKTGDLYVGAPGRTVDGASNAGAIDYYHLRPDGSAAFVRSLTEDDRPAPATATAGNRLGAVLAGYVNFNFDSDPASAFGGVLAGVPNETVDGKAQAGAVIAFTHFNGSSFSADTLTQNSPDVAGVAEPGDHFGASVGAYQLGIAIGVPGEDIGAVKDAGLVATFGNDLDDDRGPIGRASGSFTQNSPGVPGVAEAGDQFGASVAIGQQDNVPLCEFDLRPATVLAVGVPGEDNGGHVDSGTAIVQTLRPQSLPDGSCKSVFAYRALTQGPGTVLGGANEPGDEVGAAVDVTPGGPAPGLVVVGVPGEDVATTTDAGVAQSYDNLTHAVAVLGNLGGRRAGLHFGAVLPNEGAV